MGLLAIGLYLMAPSERNVQEGRNRMYCRQRGKIEVGNWKKRIAPDDGMRARRWITNPPLGGVLRIWKVSARVERNGMMVMAAGGPKVKLKNPR